MPPGSDICLLASRVMFSTALQQVFPFEMNMNIFESDTRIRWHGNSNIISFMKPYMTQNDAKSCHHITQYSYITVEYNSVLQISPILVEIACLGWCNFVSFTRPVDLWRFDNPDYVQGSPRACSSALTHAGGLKICWPQSRQLPSSLKNCTLISTA